MGIGMTREGDARFLGGEGSTVTEQRPSEVPFKIMTAAAVAATVVVRAHYEKRRRTGAEGHRSRPQGRHPSLVRAGGNPAVRADPTG